MHQSRFRHFLVSIVCLFSFTTSFVVPELLHSAAHFLTQTSHIDHQSSLSGRNVSSPSSDDCVFERLLAAHLGHSNVNSVASTFLIATFEGNSVLDAFEESILRISVLSFEARGPPTAFSLA